MTSIKYAAIIVEVEKQDTSKSRGSRGHHHPSEKDPSEAPVPSWTHYHFLNFKLQPLDTFTKEKSVGSSWISKNRSRHIWTSSIDYPKVEQPPIKRKRSKPPFFVQLGFRQFWQHTKFWTRSQSYCENLRIICTYTKLHALSGQSY